MYWESRNFDLEELDVEGVVAGSRVARDHASKGHGD